MNSSEISKVISHLTATNQLIPSDLSNLLSTSTGPSQFFHSNFSTLPPHISILFSSHTTPFSRSTIPTIKKRRKNYARLSQPQELSLNGARERIPYLWSKILEEDHSNQIKLGDHDLGRSSDDKSSRLDHILDVVEEELVEQRFKEQKEREEESLPEREDETMEEMQIPEFSRSREEKETREYENMLEFEREVLELFLKGDVSSALKGLSLSFFDPFQLL